VTLVGLIRSPAVGTLPNVAARIDGDAVFGGYTFARPIVSAIRLPPDLDVDGILGFRALKEFSVSLDQRTGRVRLTRGASVVGAAPPFRDRGIAVEYSRGALRVLAVIPHSPADSAGIVAGDTVLTAGGHDTSGYSPSDWDPLAHGVAPITLLIAHDGKRRTVTLGSTILIP
jgi:hypothetical protein